MRCRRRFDSGTSLRVCARGQGISRSKPPARRRAGGASIPAREEFSSAPPRNCLPGCWSGSVGSPRCVLYWENSSLPLRRAAGGGGYPARTRLRIRCIRRSRLPTYLPLRRRRICGKYLRGRPSFHRAAEGSSRSRTALFRGGCGRNRVSLCRPAPPRCLLSCRCFSR